MGDAETAAAAATDYTSSGYTTTDYNSAVPDGVALDPGAGATIDPNSVASMDETYAISDASTFTEVNTYNTATDSVMQDPPVNSAYEDTTTAPVAEVIESQVTQESAVVESTHAAAAAYDSVNANGVAVGHDVNGITPNNGSTDASEQQFDEAPVSTEEGRLWSIVKANSLDFNSWTALIEETERVAEDNILKIRKIYDAFLAEFPLCYGYWKKYAEHESRLGYIEKVVEVFERGVAAVTYSVDMWLHYCIFAVSTYGDPEKVRRLFERGLAYVGTDYLSYPLWDKYIEYEYSLQQWCHLAVIYTRILENPNQQLDRYVNSFKELAGSRPLSELQTAEEAAVVAATKFETSTEGTDSTIHSDASLNTDSAIAGTTEFRVRLSTVDTHAMEKAQEHELLLTEMKKSAEKLGSSTENYGDPMLKRFLIARSMDPAKAAKMLVQWKKWRQEFVPLGYIPDSEVPEQLDAKKIYLQGLSRSGQPLVVIKTNMHYAPKDQLQFKKFIVHFLDKAIASSFKDGREVGNEKLIGIIDMANIGYKNVDPRALITGFQFLQAYYPERLEKLFIISMPWFFVRIWKMISHFLEKATLDKVVIVSNEDEREKFMDEVGEETLPEEYGGRAKLVALQDVKLDHWPVAE